MLFDISPTHILEQNLEARAYPGWFCQEGTRKKRIHPNLHR